MYNEQWQKDLKPRGKIWNKMREDSKKIERIETIAYEYSQGKDISWGDLLFLQENQEFIKQVFSDDIQLWELAGIPEEDWKNRNQGGKHE